MTYDEAMAWLEGHYNLEAIAAGVGRRGPTLDRVRRLVEHLGEPQRAFRTIHITGTNGKGSTARLAASALTAHGLRVGLVTSPHLHRLEERLCLDGSPIPPDELAEALTAVARAEAATGTDANYFEVMAATGYWWLARRGVDAAVVEVGAGGRFDATNVVDAEVAVVTNVALDHAELLGPTLVDIATEKAGIVKAGSVLVLGETGPELAAPFLAAPAAEVWHRSADFGWRTNVATGSGRLVDLYAPSRAVDGVAVPLHGAHQGDNAACAFAAVAAFLGPQLSASSVREGFASARHPGRFEVVGERPLVVVDGAHNPAGATASAATRREFHPGPFVLVTGMNRGRDARDVLEALEADRARRVITTRARWAKSMATADLDDAAASLGVVTEAVEDVGDAVREAIRSAAEDELVLIAGSLYVVAEARAALGLA